MNTFVKLFAATGLVAGFAAPVLAQDAMADPMTMTCADYSAMDATGMAAATQEITAYTAMTPEDQTAAMAMTPEEKTAKKAESDAAMAAMTDEQKATAATDGEAAMTKLKAACAAMPDGTVMDAAKSSM